MGSTGKSKLWRWIRCAALLLIVATAWHVLNRARSASRAVSIHELTSHPQPETSAVAGTLKLATFNIAHGRGTNASNFSVAEERRVRLEKIASLLKDEAVDIAVLQEVDFDAVWTGHEDQATLIARAAGFPYVFKQRNIDVAFPFVRLRFGNAILSRRKIVEGRFVPLPVRSRREQYLAGAKHGSYADVELGQGARIRIFPIHLEWRDEATRVRCTDLILAHAKESPHPFFCIGDFNSTPTHFPFSEQNARGVSLLDVLLKSERFQTRPESAPGPEQMTWPSYAPIKVIDWIMVPAGWAIVDYRVCATDLSDHRPVFMEVRRP